jgi:hypothetical protein
MGRQSFHSVSSAVFQNPISVIMFKMKYPYSARLVILEPSIGTISAKVMASRLDNKRDRDGAQHPNARPRWHQQRRESVWHRRTVSLREWRHGGFLSLSPVTSNRGKRLRVPRRLTYSCLLNLDLASRPWMVRFSSLSNCSYLSMLLESGSQQLRELVQNLCMA